MIWVHEDTIARINIHQGFLAISLVPMFFHVHFLGKLLHVHRRLLARPALGPRLPGSAQRDAGGCRPGSLGAVWEGAEDFE